MNTRSITTLDSVVSSSESDPIISKTVRYQQDSSCSQRPACKNYFKPALTDFFC